MSLETEILALTVAAMAAIGLTPIMLRYASRRLRPGDRLRIGAGFEVPAPWLSGRPYVEGIVHSVIDEEPPGLVIVRLSEQLRVDAEGRTAAGEFAVLHLRYRGARWGRRGVVSVRLGARSPSSAPDANGFPLVESHAMYRRVR